MKSMFEIDDMCKVFGVARSGYYSWLTSPLCKRDKQEITIIKPAILQAFEESRQTYGCARISAVLNKIGIPISEKRSRRLMREENLIPKAARKFKRTTNSKHNHKKLPDLVKQNFSSPTPHFYLYLDQGRMAVSCCISGCVHANGCRLGCQCYNGRKYAYKGF